MQTCNNELFTNVHYLHTNQVKSPQDAKAKPERQRAAQADPQDAGLTQEHRRKAPPDVKAVSHERSGHSDQPARR